MIQPVANLDVLRTVVLIAQKTPFGLQFNQPTLNISPSGLGAPFFAVVIGVKKAREHSRIPAKPPDIIRKRPNLNEQEPTIATHAAHAFRLRELWFDGPDSRHYSTPRTIRHAHDNAS